MEDCIYIETLDSVLTDGNPGAPAFSQPYAPSPGLLRHKDPFIFKATWQCGMEWQESSSYYIYVRFSTIYEFNKRFVIQPQPYPVSPSVED